MTERITTPREFDTSNGPQSQPAPAPAYMSDLEAEREVNVETSADAAVAPLSFDELKRELHGVMDTADLAALVVETVNGGARIAELESETYRLEVTLKDVAASANARIAELEAENARLLAGAVRDEDEIGKGDAQIAELKNAFRRVQEFALEQGAKIADLSDERDAANARADAAERQTSELLRELALTRDAFATERAETARLRAGLDEQSATIHEREMRIERISRDAANARVAALTADNSRLEALGRAVEARLAELHQAQSGLPRRPARPRQRRSRE